MRILIDIGHPAHVHLFKHFAWEMNKNGHQLLFTCREKEFEIHLLTKYGFDFISLGKKFKSKLGKIVGMFLFDIGIINIARKFKPDIFLSHGSIYAAHTAFFLGKPHISLEDTFNFEQIRLYKPFTKVILTADYDHPLKSKKVIRYAGYHELAYLHPKRFLPNHDIMQELWIKNDEKYVILRFVSWSASHDAGHKGMSFENKLKAVELFSKYAKVFISSESPLPSILEPYRFPLPPEQMHDAIAFATFVFGESFTMLSEAAVLGIPAILIHDTHSYYLQEQENEYRLVFNYSEDISKQIMAIDKGIELLKQNNLREEWQKRRAKMLADKIDVTAFLVWFVENYPESFEIMRKNPDYQYNFK